MNKINIILIGMPGVGKSTAGVLLAKNLGYDFLDTDLLIQQDQGMRLSEIIEKKGRQEFLSIENRIHCNLQVNRTVVATGGSVVYGEAAMEHLRDIGTVVYLSLPYRQLRRRLRNIKNRGVVFGPGQGLRDLYEERSALYEKYAHICVDEAGKNLEETVEAILSQLESV